MYKPKLLIIFSILSIVILCIGALPYFTWKLVNLFEDWAFIKIFISGGVDALLLSFLVGILYLNKEIQRNINEAKEEDDESYSKD